MNSIQTRAIVAMALGGLLFGFDTAVISGVTEALRLHFALGATALGTLVSAALWGTLLGAMGSGVPGDRYGSLGVLKAIAVLYLVSAIGCAVAPELVSLTIFRFLGGIAIGGTSVLVPIYIAEISPPDRRGRLVGLFQLNIVIGILAAYLSNFAIGLVTDGEIEWRVKFAAAALPAALFALLLIGLPLSPRWLLTKGRNDEAADAAARLGLTIVPEPAGEGGGKLSWRHHRAPILLAVAIGLFNQLSGINAILYYLNDIFASAGFTGASSDVQAIAIGLANLLATAAAMTLIDRIGRKPLLIGGGIFTAIALAGVALVYQKVAPASLLLPLLVLFIVAFAMSQGAVIWVYISEIFPGSVRARGQSIGSATHWVANAVLSFGFPIIAQQSAALPFWFFAAAMLTQAVLVALFFPETKGRTLEELGSGVSGLQH